MPAMQTDEKHPPMPGPPPLDTYARTTRNSYASIWRCFTTWLELQPPPHMLPLSPQRLLTYLQHLADAGRKWATIESHRALIAKAHRRAGLPNPSQDEEFKDQLKNLARQVGRRQSQVRGMTSTAHAAIDATAAIPRRTRGGRTETPEAARRRAAFDQALVSVMREGLLRCDEASKLLCEDVEQIEDGTGRILIRRSKTDQAGEGALLFISSTSMAALDHLRAHQPTPTPRIFPLSTAQLRRRIKSAAAAAGLTGNYGGHSARIGMAVDLAQLGFGLPEIQNAGRWKSPIMPGHYIRGIDAGQGAVARYCQIHNR